MSSALNAAAVGVVGCAVGYCIGKRNTERTNESEEKWSTGCDKYIPKKRHVTPKTAAEGRQVICCDALEWMEKVGTLPGSVVSGLPDISEMKELGDDGYSRWFSNAVSEIMKRLREGQMACFHQTDTRANRRDTLSKAALVIKGVEQSGVKCTLLWHKVSLAAPCGHTKIARPSFTHMMLYIKGPPPPSSIPQYLNFPDCIDRGQLVWSRGMGLISVLKTIDYMKHVAGDDLVIVDPFCGHGTVPAVANHLGLRSIGVDLSPKCCKKATTANISDLLDKPTLIKNKHKE